MEIRFTPTNVTLDYPPSWRLHRNPFWRLRDATNVTPPPASPPPVGQYPSQMVQQQQQQQVQQGMMSPGMQQQQGMIQQPNMMQPGMQQQNMIQQQHMMQPGMQQPNMMMQPGMQNMQPGMMSPQGSMMQQQPGMHPGMMQPSPYPGMPPQVVKIPSNTDTNFAFHASNDRITGQIVIQPKAREHGGIRVQLVGRIHSIPYEGRHYEFLSLSKELAPPGLLQMPETVLPFVFPTICAAIDSPDVLESYKGRNVSVQYLIRVVMERQNQFLPPISLEREIWIQAPTTEQAVMKDVEHESIQMEVGIEDCLHIEFTYERRYYHLTDVIRGKIQFLLVRIKIKHMELAVMRRETSGDAIGTDDKAPNVANETQTLTKYEIMDGAPVKGEVIPVKLALKGVPADLTPTYNGANNRFRVRYYLNLVLVDEDDRRYFKQQEIILWRREDQMGE